MFEVDVGNPRQQRTTVTPENNRQYHEQKNQKEENENTRFNEVQHCLRPRA